MSKTNFVFVPYLSTFHGLLNLCVSLGLQVPDIAEICTHLAHLSDQSIKNINLELKKNMFVNSATEKAERTRQHHVNQHLLQIWKTVVNCAPKAASQLDAFFVFFLFQTFLRLNTVHKCTNVLVVIPLLQEIPVATAMAPSRIAVHGIHSDPRLRHGNVSDLKHTCNAHAVRGRALRVPRGLPQLPRVSGWW